MPSLTIAIDEDVRKVLAKRAKKNFMTLRELVEDIVRRSAVRTKRGSSSNDHVDDKLVGIFSRTRRGRKKKAVKKSLKKTKK